MPFAMNFTSVRIDEKAGTLSVQGFSEPGDDPVGLSEVEGIEIVVHGEDEEQGVLAQRLVTSEAKWTATYDVPLPYGRGDVVYVVGMAVRPAADPFVWFNRFTVMSITDRIRPSTE